MSTFITVPNDWDLEVERAIKLALAEYDGWFLVTESQRAAVRRQIMGRLKDVLPLGGGGPVEPTGGGSGGRA